MPARNKTNTVGAGGLRPVNVSGMREALVDRGRLTRDERRLIVQQALVLLEQHYVHLPMKRAIYAVDPVQRLKLLMRRLETSEPLPNVMEFHRELLDTMYSVRDIHTRYLLPQPYSGLLAYLPFRVEEYWHRNRRRYVVTSVRGAMATLKPGVEVLHWNGVPIDWAVWNHAQRLPGSNPEARHARGLLTLTIRPLAMAPLPDEDWVTVSYRTLDGGLAERQIDWKVVSTQSRVAELVEADLEVHSVKRMQMELFAPLVADAARAADSKRRLRKAPHHFENILQGTDFPTRSGTFAYVRIWTFQYGDVDAFVGEFVRLITTLSQDGLIIDIRDNGGGKMRNAERILQTLTPRRIKPEPLEFLNSTSNLQICRRPRPADDSPDLQPWIEAIEEGLRTGAVYSSGFPQSSDDAEYNGLGQKYFGPVVLITSALSYSAADMFAAGFQDHDIGLVLGTHPTTGGGGANTWKHERFLSYRIPGRIYRKLPKGADLCIAIRRSLRVGRRAGAVLEDFGVRPDRLHPMTLKDVLRKNEKLLDHAGKLLKGRPVRAFKLEITENSPRQVAMRANTRGMSRLDVYVDGRPLGPVKIIRGQASFVVGRDSKAKFVEVRGYAGSTLVARFRQQL